MNRHERRAQAAKRIGADVRYGGRTIEIKVFVNTDEDEHAVVKRVQDAAKGPKKCMTVVMAGFLSEEDAKRVWDLTMERAIDREVDKS